MVVKKIEHVSGLTLSVFNGKVSLKIKGDYSDDYKKDDLVDILKNFIEFMESN